MPLRIVKLLLFRYPCKRRYTNVRTFSPTIASSLSYNLDTVPLSLSQTSFWRSYIGLHRYTSTPTSADGSQFILQ